MNKTTQNYFINLFKRKKRVLALYTFVVFMAFPFLLITNFITDGGTGIADITKMTFVLMLLVLGVLGAVLPLFTFKFAFVKKNVDTYFSIPINRNHLFKAHFFAPIIGTILPILASYLVGGLLLIPSSGISAYFELLIVLLLSFVIFFVIYSVNTFFILKCNNVLDASLITAAVGIVPLMLYGAVYAFLRSQIVPNGMIDNVISFIPQLIIDLLCPYKGLVVVVETLRSGSSYSIYASFSDFDYVLYFYYVVIGILFAIQAQISFKGKKGEDAEQLTTHFLTYPLLSNIGLIALILNFNFTEYDITTAILIVIALFVIYMIINGIANRSFKITMRMIVKFIVLFVIINAFNIISKETEFFGYNRKVIDYRKYEEVEISYHYYDYEKNTEDYQVVEIKPKEISETEQELLDYFEIIQAEKSKAFKDDDYDVLYPYNEKGDYSIAIHYDLDVDINTDHTEYVHYQLSENHAKIIREYIREIIGR